MVTLRTVDETLRDAVLDLAPGPGQERFSGAAANTLPAAELHRTRCAVAILREARPVGFLALDDADPICAYGAPQPSVALRAFFVDARFQRRGIAAAALGRLPAFVTAQYPKARSMVLTVNVSNPVATALYQRAGYVDTGRVHVGGTAGPQHVLVLGL